MDDSRNRERSECHHRLPVTRGFSGNWNARDGWTYTVRCGHCKANIKVDLEWAEAVDEARGNTDGTRAYYQMMES